MIVATVDFQKL